MNSGGKKHFHRKAPASVSVKILRFFSVNFFLPHSLDFLKKLLYWGSNLAPPPIHQLLIPLRQLSLTSIIFIIEFNISVEISAANICKNGNFSGEIFFHRILLVALKYYFSPHSAGSAEKIFFHRILRVAVKNFLPTLKR